MKAKSWNRDERDRPKTRVRSPAVESGLASLLLNTRTVHYQLSFPCVFSNVCREQSSYYLLWALNLDFLGSLSL